MWGAALEKVTLLRALLRIVCNKSDAVADLMQKLLYTAGIGNRRLRPTGGDNRLWACPGSVVDDLALESGYYYTMPSVSGGILCEVGWGGGPAVSG